MASSARHGFEASAAGPFENLVYDLTAGDGSVAAVERLGPDLALLRTRKSGVPVVVARYLPGVEEQLGEIMHALKDEGAEVVLVGGPDEAHEQLASLRPTLSERPVQLYHITDERKLWKKAAGLLRGEIDQFLEVGPPPRTGERDWNAFWSRASTDHAVRGDKARELGEFQKRLASKRRIFTWVIAGVLGLIFVLEMAWGGSENGETLIRMGALVKERTFAGEWWRLLSCTCLHYGAAHFLMNTYVLIALGSFLEGVIGARRMLILYALSGLGGSLASLFVGGAGIMVGASGAIWGILGAQAVLAYVPRGVLPAVLIPGAKRAAMTNLMINVMVSFLPGVSASAHFGGGAVGALLVLTGVATAGMSRNPRTVAIPGAPDADAPPFWLTPVAAACAFALLASIALAFSTGRPWE